MSSHLRHRLPSVDGPNSPFASGFLGSNPSVLPKESQLNGATVIGKDESQMVVGNIYETFEIQNATFVQSDDDRQRLKFAEWLNFKSHDIPHETAFRSREPGTGVWFLEGSTFEKWIQNPASPLWIHGGVGCGKTVLCASIIEKIRELGPTSGVRTLCYFYCSFQDDSRQDLKALLRLLAGQLCSATHIPHQLHELYENCRKEYPPRAPHNEELIRAIFSILKDHEGLSDPPPVEVSLHDSSEIQENPNAPVARNTYLIVDALDEIPTIQQEDVLDFLQRLAGLELRNLRILVTGRTEPSIVEALVSPWLPVTMNALTVNQDIRLYVSRAIEKHKKLKRQTVPTKELIRQRLVEGGNGMFRWAALQMEELKRIEVATRDTIEDVLLKLPKDLNKTYARILGAIGDVLHQRAFTALQWLVSSPRPMLIEELIDACVVDFNKKPIVDPAQRLTPFNIFEMLHDLVTIQPSLKDDNEVKDGTHRVVIAHFSVQEFLTGKDIIQSEARAFRINNEISHLFIARSCLAYLYHYSSFEHRHERFPLREYAWYNWERHILPESIVANSQVRRKAMMMFKFLDAEFMGSNYVLATHIHSNWPAVCCAAIYWCFLWLLQLYWIPTPMEVMKQNLALAIDWLPENGVEKLKDSLNTPYFFKDFDAFQARPSKDMGYIYRPVNSEGINFRLLTILPALDENTIIKCRLLPASLGDHQTFDALSYTWGDYSDRKETWVDGSRFQVGSNLAQILQFVRARQEFKFPRLWVDALCINQSDIMERSHMVTIMGTLFREAQEVVVGLGEEKDGDEAAIKTLTQLAASLPVSAENDNIICGKECKDLILGIGEDIWHAILDLFRNPWWSRMWVIQEIVLAANATLFLGSLSLNFDIIGRVMRFERLISQVLEEEKGHLFSNFLKDPRWQTACRLAVTRNEHKSGVPLTLARALYRFRTHKCVDPRDKLYSLYGIIDGEDEFIKVDYEESSAVIFLQFGVTLLRLHRRLDIFSYTSVCNRENYDIASWVPSFEPRPNVLILDPGVFGDIPVTNIFMAGSPQLEAIFFLFQNATLNVKGIAFDEISRTRSIYSENVANNENESVRNNLELREIQSHLIQKPASQSVIEASWRTVLADQWPPGRRLTQGILGQSIVPPRTKQEEELLMQEPCLTARLEFVHGRQFIITAQGRIGLGPQDALPGDIVAVMPGGAVPYVLRPRENETGYILIGEW